MSDDSAETLTNNVKIARYCLNEFLALLGSEEDIGQIIRLSGNPCLGCAVKIEDPAHVSIRIDINPNAKTAVLSAVSRNPTNGEQIINQAHMNLSESKSD